jgi:hypothetical protein|tara:strand:+ start:167 stop:373 length:207 start_codon:yes stop_codon:yes gene_type:complete
MNDTNNPNSKVNPQDELRDLIQILPQEMCGEDPDYSVLEEMDYDDRDATGQDSCDGSTPSSDMPTHEY